MTAHISLSEANLHECKGASSATSGTVPTANGSGSTVWSNPLSTLNNKNKMYLFGQFTDISAASSIFIPTTIAGLVSRITVTLQGAITTANSIVTAKINGVAVTGVSITVAYTASTGGSTFTGTASAANSLAANAALEIVSDGGSSTTMAAIVVVELDVS